MIEENKEYYLSTINDINKWKDINEEDLSDFKDDKVTEKLNNLMKKYEIYSNVNFFIESETKKINIDKNGGGWSKKSSSNSILDGGGWGAHPRNNQTGGGDWLLEKIFK